ncbi:MAG: restriction endonuclease [Chloroflexota bacterium]
MTLNSNYQILRNRAEETLERILSLSATDAHEALQEVDPAVFEHLTAMVFEARGYRTEDIGNRRNEGIALLLRRGRTLSVVQCKRSSDSVGQPTVRDLYGTMMHNEAEEALLVTTGTITRQAREWAFGKPIQLVDGYTLVEWIESSKPQLSRRSSQAISHGRISQKGITQDRISEDVSQSRSSFKWLWPVIVVALILFGVAAGLALTTFTERLGDTPNVDIEPTQGEPVQSEPVAVENGLEDNTPEFREEDGSSNVDETSTPDEISIPEKSETSTPMEAPLPVCNRTVDPRFQALYRQEGIGCPNTDLLVIWSAWQPFERGFMYWRQDNDTSYVLLGTNDGKWFAPELPSGVLNANRGAAPPGGQAPVRGFGYIWSNDDAVFNSLGWATDKEKGFCSAVQGFEAGIIIQSIPVDSCSDQGHYNQAKAADWQPLTIVANLDGRWANSSNLPPPTSGTEEEHATPPVQLLPVNTTPTDSTGTRTRPAAQGTFRASRITGLVLDGDLTEWEAGQWISLQSVVWGNDQWDGQTDLSGTFQVRWSNDGLWLAIRITDDRYQSGPFGTNMWQGDGLEIHLDRELENDFTDSELSPDDYQIGVNFGPSLNQTTAYRWIPYEEEGTIPISGASRETDDGYQAEMLLPWETFGISSSQRQPGTLIGFNLSVNDNDSNSPSQETTLSASPARTNHHTPTEWGTLILEEGR